MKPFSKWKIHEVEKEFQVEQQDKYALLDEWIEGSDEPFDDAIQNTLQNLQKRLMKHVYSWNEQELKVQFIGPLLNSIDFDEEQYHPFFEREIATTYKNETCW